MFFKDPRVRVGAFIVAILFILTYATLKVSKQSFLPGGSQKYFVVIESAVGMSQKTPVQIAGVQIGYVSEIELLDNSKAKLTLKLSKKVKLADGIAARVRSMGFLGDTYIDLIQPVQITSWLEPESTIPALSTGGDFGSLGGELSDVTGDVKAITTTLRKYMAGDDSSFAHTLTNIEKLTETLGRVSVQNEQNLNAIIGNFKAVSENLNLLIARNFSRIDNTAGNMEEITEKIKRGEGTLGKLVNDDATVEKLNESIDNLNDLLGSSNKLELDMGYHTEYLSSTEQFKHYVSLALKPKPDKYFLFELVDDPAPDTRHKTKTSQITTNGVTTTVREEIETDDTDRFIFSAQFAKQFYDFTLRGGLIESSGGAGIDYRRGPVGAQFSAFDFETKHGEKPHLKATGTYNITKSFYVIGGADDFINPEQDTDWVMGAGISVTDDDLKSVLGMSKLKP